MGVEKMTEGRLYEILGECKRASGDAWSKRNILVLAYDELLKKQHIDEEKSVIWNRNEKEKQKRALKSKITRAGNEFNSAYRPFLQAVSQFCADEYILPRDVAQLCASKAEEDAHGEGGVAIVCKAKANADFAEQILSLVL